MGDFGNTGYKEKMKGSNNMNNPIVERAKEIIFSNEGKYGSVNQNDNGALSVGICQWHGDRAKELLKNILVEMRYNPQKLTSKIFVEIFSSISWNHKVLTVSEKACISVLLESTIGQKLQNEQADKDILHYITHIMSLGFKDEESIIFLADIENQGGAGASERIAKTSYLVYGKAPTLEQVVKVSLQDYVFCKYTARRLTVYKKLTGRDYVSPPTYQIVYYTVKRGDTLTKIANKYGLTVDKIAKDNNIANPNILINGQKLKIAKVIK